MADYMLLGLFSNVDTTADVVDALREQGVNDEQVTILSNIPYSEKFFGRKPERLWFLPFVLAGAATGAVLAWFLTFVTPDIYPIHVGGQELTPVPPSAIIFFELIALMTMVFTFIGFLVQARLPIMVKQMYDERITDGYIGVEVSANTSQLDPVVAIFEEHHAVVIHREDGAAYKPQGMRHMLFWGGVGTAGLVALLVPLLLSYDVISLPWINTMSSTVVTKWQEGPRTAAPAEAIPVGGPVLINGQPASLPLPATDRSLERGQRLYDINCAMCHGADGGGNGPVSIYYTNTALQTKFPRGVPALAGRDLPENYVFLTITNGIMGTDPETGDSEIRMPSLGENLSAGDTWDIVNYVRSLPAPAAD